MDDRMLKLWIELHDEEWSMITGKSENRFTGEELAKEFMKLCKIAVWMPELSFLFDSLIITYEKELGIGQKGSLVEKIMNGEIVVKI